MKNKISIFVFYQQFFLSASEWQLPNPEKRLDQLSFAVAHNAYANVQDGWYGNPQQFWHILNQLNHGIRGFMLDTWKYHGRILLCHGGCQPPMMLYQKGNLKHSYFVEVLNLFADWLAKHPQEILIIFLENRVDNDFLAKTIENVAALRPLILTPSDWDPKEHDTAWPTLKWLREHNKRIIFFNEDKSNSRALTKNDPFFFIYDYVIENQWGTVDGVKVCGQRKESCVTTTGRSLYLFNYFCGYQKNIAAINSAHRLKKVITHCSTVGNVPKRKPNFIALDFVNHGDYMRLINEYNQRI